MSIGEFVDVENALMRGSGANRCLPGAGISQCSRLGSVEWHRTVAADLIPQPWKKQDIQRDATEKHAEDDWQDLAKAHPCRLTVELSGAAAAAWAWHLIV